MKKPELNNVTHNMSGECPTCGDVLFGTPAKSAEEAQTNLNMVFGMHLDRKHNNESQGSRKGVCERNAVRSLQELANPD